MAAGSPVGHIALWDLEEKKLMSQMRNAHSTAVAGMSFVPGEPLLITNGADNAIRVSYGNGCYLMMCFGFFLIVQSSKVLMCTLDWSINFQEIQMQQNSNDWGF